MHLSGILRETEQLLFPSRCVCCGDCLLRSAVRGAGRDYPLCEQCEERLREELILGARCTVCGRPLTGEKEVCTACRGRSYSYLSVRPLGLYTGTLAAALRAYKLQQCKLLAGFFADLLAPVFSTAGEEGTGPHIFVRVPSRPASVRTRGWDHTGEIVRELYRNHRVRFRPVLYRRPGRAQKGLDFDARNRNLRGKIEVRAREAIHGAQIICFDDILTTGATLDACSAALKAAGALEVRAVVIAADP